MEVTHWCRRIKIHPTREDTSLSFFNTLRASEVTAQRGVKIDTLALMVPRDVAALPLTMRVFIY